MRRCAPLADNVWRGLASNPPTVLEPHKQAEIASRTDAFMAGEASKPFGWEPDHWVRWATIADALQRLGIQAGATVLDVGCGSGWTSLFLAESGYRVTGIDLVPANVELSAARARRWGVEIDFQVADMDELSLPGGYDAALVYDALHHSTRPYAVVPQIASHLAPGGWALFGEPSWLHDISPGARRTTRERGWHERGIQMRSLKRACREAGLGDFRRFFQGTHPYKSRGRGFAWQLVRLVAANVAVAPQSLIWLAARRPSG
jgi:2-polyprenyl-3-methyl-5-hydroxy-6-metoxy-1,4-benzoquinol methylase